MIRTAQLSDAEAIQRIYAPIVAETPISFEIEIPTILEIQERIRKTLVQYPWLVYELDGKVVAYAYASTHRARSAYQWTAEVTIYVDQKCHGRGIGKVLYQKLFEILRKQGYRTAVGGITLPNSGSVAIHESLGFKKVAHFKSVGYKAGAWHDVGFWQLELQPHILNPAQPVSFSGIHFT
jgi:phosphinothricin acetyltransferase